MSRVPRPAAGTMALVIGGCESSFVARERLRIGPFLERLDGLIAVALGGVGLGQGALALRIVEEDEGGAAGAGKLGGEPVMSSDPDELEVVLSQRPPAAG